MSFETRPVGAGEVAQQLRALAALSEEQGWVPSTHSSSRGARAVFWHPWPDVAGGMPIHMQ